MYFVTSKDTVSSALKLIHTGRKNIKEGMGEISREGFMAFYIHSYKKASTGLILMHSFK